MQPDRYPDCELTENPHPESLGSSPPCFFRSHSDTPLQGFSEAHATLSQPCHNTATREDALLCVGGRSNQVLDNAGKEGLHRSTGCKVSTE